MVKHSVALMSAFFTRERFGRPQVLAGLLLVVFVAQCAWLVKRRVQSLQVQPNDVYRVERGLRYWENRGLERTVYALPSQPAVAGSTSPARLFLLDHDYDQDHSPLWYLIASAPLLLLRRPLQPQTVHDLQWLAPVPYLLFGVLLGASLWYVSRRLYGNAGGYIALALYCFSPGIIRSSTLWFSEPQTGVAWGAFGAVFTAIAVAHTLYAPREVVLWNWRRILLLGLSFALAVGSQFSLLIVIAIALGFMLYLSPGRRAAAILIWTAACTLGCLILLASYFFRFHALFEGLRQASFFPVAVKAFAMPRAYSEVIAQLGQSSPALLLVLPGALIAYAVWPRARYFGNTAPLLVSALFFLLGLGTPHYPGLGFQFVMIPFLFVFAAGILADLLETRQRNLALTCVWALLATSAIWNLFELARVGRG